MRFTDLLLEYDRSQTVKNYAEKILAAAAKDQSIDFAAILQPFAEEGQTNYRIVLQKSPEAQQAMIDYVMGVIESADPTKNKNYAQAITRLYSMGNTLLEDIASTLSQYLVKFDKLKNKKKIPAPYNDFMRYKSMDEFMDVVEKLPDPDSEIEQQKVAGIQVPPDVEYTLLYGSFDNQLRITSDCVVLIPRNKQAGYWWAKEYPKKGVTNRWCTAWEGDNSRFDYYSSQGPLYIIIPAKRTDENEKYQFHFETKQFMDYQDHQIGDRGMDALAERFPSLTQVFRDQAINFNILALMTPEFKAAVKEHAVTAGKELDQLLDQYKERIANFGFNSLGVYGINLPEGTQEALADPIMVYLDQARKALEAKNGFWDKIRDSLGSERDENKIEVLLNTDTLLKGAMENSRAGNLVAELAQDPAISRKIDASHLQDLLLRDPLFRFIMRQVPKLYKDFLSQLEGGARQNVSEDTGLTFMGSPCTKDCSGHQAGYKWSLDRNGRVANGHSNSFNNGTNIAADVSKKRKQGGGKLPGYVSQTKDAIRKRAARAFGKTTLGQDDNLQEGSNQECPPATQDIRLNLKNRQKAIDEYGYGPLNPDLPNTKFWMKKVDEWNLDSVEEAQQSLCGNCAAFDQRQETLDCIAQGIDVENPADAKGTIDAGDLGYCKFLKFKCASRRTCDAWITGGPLTDATVSEGKVKDFAIQKSERDEMTPQQFFGQYGKTKDMWDTEHAGMFTSKIAAKKKPATAKKTARALDYCPACGREDNRCICESMTEGRAYYNVIGTSDEELQKQFGMRKDSAGWYLNENVDKKKHATAYRAFGAPKLKEFDMAAFSGDAATQGPDNVVGPLTKQIKRK